MNHPGASITHLIVLCSQGDSHRAADLRIVVHHKDAACAPAFLPICHTLHKDAQLRARACITLGYITPRVVEFGHVRIELLKDALRADP